MSTELYSSVVLAILLSTIIAPFSLRFTIGYFNKRAIVAVKMAEEQAAAGGVDAALQVCTLKDLNADIPI